MKYGNISLNNNKYGYAYGLLKYEYGYDYMLNRCELSTKMKNDIKLYSEIMDDNNNQQAYMISNGCKCIGGIVIDGRNNDSIKMLIELDDSFSNSEKRSAKLLENVIESLKIFFYDKKKIEVKIINKKLTSIFNSINSSDIYRGNDSEVYVFDNDYYELIPALINEIKGTEQNFIDWKQNWHQDIIDKKYGVSLFDDFFDKNMIEKLNNGTLSIDEAFYKANKIELNDIISKKNERSIEFYRNGNIEFRKRSRKRNKAGKTYCYNYNVCCSGFVFKTTSGIIIQENGLWTMIKACNTNIKYLKEEKEILYTYISPNIDNSSMKIEIRTDINNNIKKCYVDFRTHKNGRRNVNGTYALRINKECNYYRLNFLSRRGNKEWSIFDSLKELYSNLYSQIISDELTPELLDILIKILTIVVNKDADKKVRKKFDYPSESIVSNMFNLPGYVVNYLKELKGEIPLPHLKDIVEQFIERQEFIIKCNKKSDKVKALKRKG